MKKENTIKMFFLNAKRYTLNASSGFTLVEMLIAFGIFAVIMVMAVGSLLSIMQANYKAQTLKSVVNNLHFAFENITRNLRTGYGYHCDSEGDLGRGKLAQPADCQNAPSSSIAFKGSDGRVMSYRQNGSVIERAIVSDYPDLINGAYVPITAPEVTVDQLQFYVAGSNSDDKYQPRVLILAHGSMKGKGKVPSEFTIQTLVSQRVLDVQ